MKKFLKKLETENFRLRYLKFSKIDSLYFLENFTRIIAFVMYGKFQIYNNTWYKMFIEIVEHLQAERPLDLDYLLTVKIEGTRTELFSENNKSGYSKTKFGLFIKKIDGASKTVSTIRWFLKLYGFELNDAYLVVELTPKAAKDDSVDIIEKEKKELHSYLTSVYVEGEKYYSLAIRVIDKLNQVLQYFTPTNYNDLYLLESYDYDKYSKEAVDKQMEIDPNTYSYSELTIIAEWLKSSRFMTGDFLNRKRKKTQKPCIVDGTRNILLTFKTCTINATSDDKLDL